MALATRVEGGDVKLIPLQELPDGLSNDVFEELYNEILDGNHTVLFLSHLKQMVIKYPILAQGRYAYHHNWSLLTLAIKELDSRANDAIKALIEANPHELLFRSFHTNVNDLAVSKDHYMLMPWIAERFPWVFEHPICKEAHHALVSLYTHDPAIEHSVVRKFYELLPHCLAEEDKNLRWGFPLNHFLSGSRECDPDLFEWAALKYPEAMKYIDAKGLRPLVATCRALTNRFYNENTARLCRFLIRECPESVRLQASSGALPIHYLLKRFNRPLVQDIALLCLRAYPGCVYVEGPVGLPNLRKNRAIQAVLPLVQLELDLEHEKAWMEEASEQLLEYTRSENYSHVGDIYASWVTDRSAALLKEARQQLKEVCISFQGDDEESEEESDDEGISALTSTGFDLRFRVYSR